jgi:transposase-like protein
MRVIKEMKIEAEGWADWREASRQTLQRVLDEHMRSRQKEYLERVTLLGGSDRRNGSYRRHLLTVLGDIELSVPRTRTFSARSVVAAYARREQHVDRLILACFVLGLSTRKVGEALLTILGEQAVAAFHRRRLSNRYRVLIFDGVVLSRRTGAGARRRPVLVALGLTPEGKKEVIDFRLAPAESEGAWEAFLTDLYRRGLTGEELEVIATDGGTGLLAALPLVFPHVPVQRCWAHKTRNILDKMRKVDRDEAKHDLHRISHAHNQVLARKAARYFAERWGKSYPKAVACLRDDLEELLTFFRYHDPDWRKATRTTNAIERRFVEVRRRTRPMGVFSDRTSMERILFAVFSYENKKEGTASLFLLTQNS